MSDRIPPTWYYPFPNQPIMCGTAQPGVQTPKFGEMVR